MQKITYISSIDQERTPGVSKKIKGTLNGAQLLGYSVEWVNIPPSIGFLSKFAEAIDKSKADIILVRSLCQYNFYIIPALFRAKRKGKKLIMDVPTPNGVAIQELADASSSYLRKVKDIGYLILSGPTPFWFVTRVLQYSNESKWFLIGNKSKTKLIGNGIDVNQVPVRKSLPSWDGQFLNLICVASLNYWHGIDLLIQALAKLKLEKNHIPIHLKVVGEGAVFSELTSLVKELNLDEQVEFLGFLQGEDLYKEYASAHLAVGSLALFRKNLKMASELKSREYCAVGIPFIVVGEDPDFPSEATFRIQLPNRDNIDDLVNFFRKFDRKTLQFAPSEIRLFAEKRLDFSVKIQEILEGLT